MHFRRAVCPRISQSGFLFAMLSPSRWGWLIAAKGLGPSWDALSCPAGGYQDERVANFAYDGASTPAGNDDGR
jgi:hypothetical protein